MDVWNRLRIWCSTLRVGDHGASLVEYALLVALIALACIVAVTFLGDSASSSYDTNTSSMFGAN